MPGLKPALAKLNSAPNLLIDYAVVSYLNTWRLQGDSKSMCDVRGWVCNENKAGITIDYNCL